MPEPRKVALITGITGQDGSYLAELLLAKGYVVHGIKRRSSSFNTGRIDHLYQDRHDPDVRFFLHYGDLTDATNLIRILAEVKPDEIYNLGAQSHVAVSFETPEYTANSDAHRHAAPAGGDPHPRHGEDRRASTRPRPRELYGKVQAVPQDETTPFYPRSPYAVAKLYAYWITVNYREAYGMHASQRHPVQPREPAAAARPSSPARSPARSPRSSWGCRTASSSATSMRSATGAMRGISSRACGASSSRTRRTTTCWRPAMTHTVRHFCDLAFAEAGIALDWRGAGVEEIGIDRSTGRTLVRVDPDTSARPRSTC